MERVEGGGVRKVEGVGVGKVEGVEGGGVEGVEGEGGEGWRRVNLHQDFSTLLCAQYNWDSQDVIL